ncbi:unnamed protein product [Adineta steineri]|uniref:Cytochrome P450 n=1 Tax=Adineta steineri TaxID=433720 RepID=A0A814X9X9_9BILA|nr:unnamed protein product [Adineta steineri]CAF1495898.1 unnamed protein product [Adineta steineri]
MTIFDNQSRILVQYYDECIRKDNGQPRDLYGSISACTLDIITESAMGKNAGAQKSLALDINNDFVDATGRVARIVHVRMRSPWLWPAFIFNRLPSGREHNQLLKILHGFSREIIQHRLTTFNAEQAKGNSEKKNRRPLVFLDNLISQMHAEQLSMDDIQEEVDGFILEGHDTTANAINYTCYLIGSYPDVQAKVHAEIDAIFADDFERACTMEDTYHMTYLESVIKESMRIFPPVPLIGREIQEDFVYRGETIRKGTTVVVFLPGIHQDPSVFPDPDKFDPDRFSASAERSKDWSPYGFIPFSVGSRNCIGQ